MPTFHPAYLLRNPAEKRNAWADLQQVMKHFGKQGPQGL
jgi:DNA polymerase